MQELFITFLFVLVALFLQELARRATQRVSTLSPTERPVTYFDFVRGWILYPCFQKQDSLSQAWSICAYTLTQLIYFPWLVVVWWYTTSIPKVSIPSPTIFSFVYFLLNFWIMFFIAVSVFLPYWLFGLLSFWRYRLMVNVPSVPYQGRFSTGDVKYHMRHYGFRVLSWCLLLGMTFMVFGITLLIRY